MHGLNMASESNVT